MKTLTTVLAGTILLALGLPGPAQAQKSTPSTDSISLNSSRSNTSRAKNSAHATEKTTVKGSKSNSNDRTTTGKKDGKAGIAVSDPGVPNK